MIKPMLCLVNSVTNKVLTYDYFRDNYRELTEDELKILSEIANMPKEDVLKYIDDFKSDIDFYDGDMCFDTKADDNRLTVYMVLVDMLY